MCALKNWNRVDLLGWCFPFVDLPQIKGFIPSLFFLSKDFAEDCMDLNFFYCKLIF